MPYAPTSLLPSHPSLPSLPPIPPSLTACVPNLVAVRRSCRKRGGTDRQADTQRDAAAYTYSYGDCDGCMGHARRMEDAHIHNTSFGEVALGRRTTGRTLHARGTRKLSTSTLCPGKALCGPHNWEECPETTSDAISANKTALGCIIHGYL